MTSKGGKAERELSNRLEDEFRYAAMPSGGSGSGTDRARPDVLAARRKPCPKRGAWDSPKTLAKVVAIEVKAWADGTGQLDEAEVRALQSFATRAGGEAYVVVRPDLRTHDQWHVFEDWRLNRTDGGNYSVRKQDLPGETLDEAFGPRYGGE